MSSLALKLVAIITMAIDHVGYYLFYLDIPFSNELHILFRIVGRVSMPIFCFMIAEGFRKTRDPYRYAVRLAIAALISEIPYNLCFGDALISVGTINVMFTLLFGLVGLILYKFVLDKTKLTTVAVLTLIPIFLVTHYTGADYGFYAPLFIFLFYIASPEKPNGRMLTVLFTVIFGFREIIEYGFLKTISLLPLLRTYEPSSLSEWSCIQIFAATAAVMLLFYNGKPGHVPESKMGRLVFKYSFYAFYPIHLILIWIIFRLIILK